jgi:hypothetical protein
VAAVKERWRKCGAAILVNEEARGSVVQAASTDRLVARAYEGGRGRKNLFVPQRQRRHESRRGMSLMRCTELLNSSSFHGRVCKASAVLRSQVVFRSARCSSSRYQSNSHCGKSVSSGVAGVAGVASGPSSTGVRGGRDVRVCGIGRHEARSPTRRHNIAGMNAHVRSTTRKLQGNGFRPVQSLHCRRCDV